MGATPSPAPVQVLGRYSLHGEIAAGGMATVHYGRLLGPVGFARTVAIKRLHPQLAADPAFVSMFLDEARLVARITHPNVVPTLDVVATEGELFLVMEYVQGESLGRLLRTARKTRTPIPPAIVTTIMTGVLHGLHAAHEATNERGEPLNIVHRDVSPHNVLVGVDGVARVLDFGVAKAIGRSHVTRDGSVRGKLAYMSPEQVGGEKTDRAADIFAAAIVLWEALAGERLFAGDTDAQTALKVLASPIAAPSSLAPGVPTALDAVVLRGLARDRSERFATAREMARALERTGIVASASDIGDWVAACAATDLRDRAAKIAKIESNSFTVVAPDSAANLAKAKERSQSSPDWTPPGAAPTFEARAESDHTLAEPATPSAISTLVPDDDEQDAAAGYRLRRRALLAGIAVLGLIGIGLLIALVRVRGAPVAGASAASPTASAPGASAAPADDAPPHAGPVGLPSAAAPTASVGASAAAVPSSPAPSAKAAPTRAAATPPPVPVRSAARRVPAPSKCKPPYTVDAAGTRHYKRECLH